MRYLKEVFRRLLEVAIFAILVGLVWLFLFVNFGFSEIAVDENCSVVKFSHVPVASCRNTWKIEGE